MEQYWLERAQVWIFVTRSSEMNQDSTKYA
jgi:hypothetical protein